MAQAAVPQRVQGFGECPPGHRFNLYLEVWNAQWEVDKNEGTKAAAAKAACAMPRTAKELLQGLHSRQAGMARTMDEQRCCVIEAETTAPFATGLGLEHPIENGFAFLSPYGLPYLAGSGVKGVLRRAAEELRDDGDVALTDAVINALFGPENSTEARRGALTCWDVFPRCDEGMTVEIMTPHFTDYYQGNESPHDAGKPNPIPFLAVPAGTKLDFVLTFETSLICEEHRDALADWQVPVRRIVAHAFEWLGFGAKTAVGYGAMREDPAQQAKFEAAQAAKAQAMAAGLKAAEDLLKTPEQLELEQATPLIDEFRALLAAEKDRNKYKPGSEFDPKRLALFQQARGWSSASARRDAAAALRESFKFTNWPGKAERKAEIKAWLTELDGAA